MKTVFTLLLLFTNLHCIYAQLAADFTTSDGITAGCSPFAVSFVNTTKGADANAVYSWDLGNGNSSSLVNPGATYITGKIYTVTLTVTDGGQTSAKTMTITVYKKPTVDFTVTNADGCAPATPLFTSIATAGDGTISEYFWNFGDGYTSRGIGLQTTTHTYTSSGTPNIDLIVTNSFGCQNSIQKSNQVHVMQPVITGFTADKTLLCNIADAVTFTNSTTGGDSLNYVWDFGDGNTSTTRNPSHVYNKKGIYSVTLTAASNSGAAGCSNTTVLPSYINVASYQTTIIAPAAICTNTSATFQSKALTVPSGTEWYFSDNNYALAGNNSSITHLFSSAGNYTVRLVNTYGSCRDTAENKIVVNDPPVLTGFIITNNSICGAPVVVNFKDTTSAAIKWNWDFNSPYHSDTSTLQAPSHTYTTDGNFTVALSVINAAGCASPVITKSINIQKPTINISYSQPSNPNGLNGCPGFSATFSASPSSLIASYKWDFGDGTTSTASTPRHTFTVAGTYPVQLFYTTTTGCSDVVVLAEKVSVFIKPVADFIASTDTVCGNTPVTFSDRTQGKVDSWQWFFGDKNNTSTAIGRDNQIVSPSYFDTGYYSVKLVAFNGTCSDTVEKKNIIYVLPPFLEITAVTNTCNGNRGTVTFSTWSQYITNWQIDYGDGNTEQLTAIQAQTVHSYAKSGAYPVIATTTQGKCTITKNATAYVLLKQSPVFTAVSDTICASDSLHVGVNNLELNPYPDSTHNNYSISTWEYGDGSVFAGSVKAANNHWSNQYNGALYGFKNGTPSLRVILRSNHFGCTDTSNYITLKIKGPIAGFGVTGNNSCFKLPVSITDSSVGTNGVPIKTWLWDFGDSTTQLLNIDSIVLHTYTNPGPYNLLLQVTDTDGCKASSNGSVIVNAIGSKADFYWLPNVVYPLSPIKFYNNTVTYGNNNTQYLWHFSSNGATSTSNTVVPHIYDNTIDMDTVRLIATSVSGQCIDTIVKLVEIKTMKLAFTYTAEYISHHDCPPMVVYIKGSSTNTNTIRWSFGDGSGADTTTTPSHTYNKPGIYKITLYGYGNNGLVDSVFSYVTIKGPYATLTASALIKCVPAAITLTANAKNAVSYNWDLGDGTLTQSNDTFIVHTYTRPGLYKPLLIMKDSAGCSSAFELADSLLMDTLHVAINAGSRLLCDTGTVNFISQIFSLSSAGSLQYQWNFATIPGVVTDSAKTQNVSRDYAMPGQYTVQLKVQSASGCISQDMDTIIVNLPVKPAIHGPLNICESAQAQFTATSNIQNNVGWHWVFSNGNTDNKQMPSAQSFPASAGPGNITLITSYNGCYDTAYANIQVKAKPVISLTPKSARICLGDSVQLTAYNNGGLYEWTAASGLHNYFIANPFVSPGKSTTYTVKVTDASGCFNYDSAVVNVALPFKINTNNVVPVCVGTTGQLHVTGAAYYVWITGVNAMDDPKSPNPVISPKVNTAYTVVGYDGYNCFTDTAIVMANIVPLPTVNAGNAVTASVGSSVNLGATGSSDITQWNWSPADYLTCTACQYTVSNPRSNITYTVTAKTKEGCTATDSVSIKLFCTNAYVFIPNAFSPNKDGVNDVFYPLGRGIKLVKHFTIFNRLGEKIFERADFNIGEKAFGWDGTYKAYPAPVGTYVYMMELECDTNEFFMMKGTIILIR